MQKRSGITIAGSTIVDKIYEISDYPSLGELTQISRITPAMGGCVANVSMDLKKICPEMDVRAFGRVGSDPEADFYIQTLTKNGIDASGVRREAGALTTCTHVMSIPGGQRTFFTYAGADADFCAADLCINKISSKILHLGYFLLLKKVDAGEGLEILKQASANGIETSIDLVSENANRYGIVLPCLPYTDYLIVNELESGRLAGIEPTAQNMEAICRKLMALGVRKKVIVHMPDRAVCLSADGYYCIGTYILPEGFIKGTTGAGDAFCAGALYGIYNDWKDKEILQFANACAAMSLRCADATGGLATAEETMKFCRYFLQRQIWSGKRRR